MNWIVGKTGAVEEFELAGRLFPVEATRLLWQMSKCAAVNSIFVLCTLLLCTRHEPNNLAIFSYVRVTNNFFSLSSVNVSVSMLARPVFRSETPVGSCTVWNTVFSPMDKCQVTKPSEAATIPSTLSSARQAPENMSHVPSSSISNQQSWVRIVKLWII